MSLQPELLFRTVIVRGLRMFRQDTRLLDQLFRNVPQGIQQEIRDFFLKHKVAVDINYPRDRIKLPAIIILLRSEQEGQAFLADSLGTDQIPEVFSYDDFSSNEDFTLLGGVASTTTLAGQGQLIYGPDSPLSATATTLTISTDEWCIDDFLVDGAAKVRIIGGTGAGQIRTISTNSTDVLTVTKPWNVIPDATSVFEIRSNPEEHIGEPSSLYTRQDAGNFERLGQLDAVGYQIQIISQQAELTVFLHTAIKALFILSRQFLEQQGIINFRMSATDFINDSDAEPNHAYMRAMNIDFLYHFDVFSELTDLAQEFRIILEQEFEGTTEIVSDTTLTDEEDD